MLSLPPRVLAVAFFAARDEVKPPNGAATNPETLNPQSPDLKPKTLNPNMIVSPELRLRACNSQKLEA